MEKITNAKLQEKCDQEKFERGVLTHCDPSGMMDWCKCCTHSNGYNCDISHNQRQGKCICAKAYRQMDKINREMAQRQK